MPLGRSRGGLWVTSWACDHADQVAGFAGIHPVFDLRTYPGLAKAAPSHELKTEELQAKLSEHNPIERVGVVVKAKVPVFIIHGDEDEVVPLKENAAELMARYEVARAKEAVTLVVAKGPVIAWHFAQCRQSTISGAISLHDRTVTIRPTGLQVFN